jgi:hypothetical protein
MTVLLSRSNTTGYPGIPTLSFKRSFEGQGSDCPVTVFFSTAYTAASVHADSADLRTLDHILSRGQFRIRRRGDPRTYPVDTTQVAIVWETRKLWPASRGKNSYLLFKING